MIRANLPATTNMTRGDNAIDVKLSRKYLRYLKYVDVART